MTMETGGEHSSTVSVDVHAVPREEDRTDGGRVLRDEGRDLADEGRDLADEGPDLTVGLLSHAGNAN